MRRFNKEHQTTKVKNESSYRRWTAKV